MFVGITNCAYPWVEIEMKAKDKSAGELAREIGIESNTISDRLKGKTEWKLWEALELKKALKSQLPIEKLFEKK